MVLTSSRIVSCEVWLILMRKTSAPASNRRRIIALSEDAGPSVARILMPRRRPARRIRHARKASGSAGINRSRDTRHPLPGLFAGFGQLHRPGALFSGVDLEKASAVETARQAVLGALDGEFLVARA